MVNNCAIGAWYEPSSDNVNGFVFPNSAWITYDFGVGTPCDHTGSGDVEMFFRLEFNLPNTGPCGGDISNSFCYVMDFMSDNTVFQIYINGLPQIQNPVPSYQEQDFRYRNREFIELCKDWQAGNNEMVVHVKSGETYAGFLAQARIPVVPDNPTVPITICKDEITVTLDAPDFQVQLLPSDLDTGSYSLCNGVELSALNTFFTCANIGENISTLIVQASVNPNFESSCQTIVNVIEGSEACPEDPCNDLSASLIPNPDFEILANGQEPTSSSQLDRAQSWVQATDATSDYFSLSNYPDREDIEGYLNPPPPNGSDHFVGGWRGFDRPRTDPVTGETQEYVEYVGGCLLDPIVANLEYTLSLDLGSPIAPLSLTPAVLDAEFLILGIPDCNFPISGQDCKEDNYEVIGRKRIQISQGTWQESVDISILSTEDYPAIIFGLSCDSEPLEAGYFLADEILVVQGDVSCSSSSDCFAITADSPSCNAELDTESNNTYTFDFTFTNNNDLIFDKLLLFDNDENFSLDAGGTLIQLPASLAPGQSVDLSWGIDALSSFSEETITYCFEIAPYNADGPCCKDQHCIELTNCCEVLAPAKTVIKADTESCCYDFGYETCVDNFFVEVEIEMLTEDLTISPALVMTGFSVTQMSDTRLVVTVNGGSFFPAGDFAQVMQFCVGGMNSMSPEAQEVTMTWTALELSLIHI